MKKIMRAAVLPLAMSAGAAIAGDNGGGMPMVPEISSGLAPLAIGIAVGVFAIYHEWRKRK